jgi:tetratricopeptide (TPR) repeat protein
LRRALGAYSERLSRDPRDVDALNRLGNLLVAAGQLGAGQSAYERALALRPDIADLHFNLGNLMQRRGEHAAARDCFNRALALQPDYAEACNNLGNTLQELGDIEAAISAYERAIASRPGFAEAHNNTGLALRRLGRHGESAAAFSRALAIKPDYALAHVNLGLALRSLERPGEALSCFDRALELTPGAANVWCFKGAAYLEQGDATAARDALERSLALDPANRAALAYRVAVMQELGERPDPPVLFDPERHIAAVDVEPPARYGSLAAFNATLAAHVREHPSLSYQRAGQATRRGAHTGNLLSGDKGPMVDLEAAIAESVRDYLANPPLHAAHPYMHTASPAWRLVAWAVVMNSGGHQIPHIHPAGWLSGVYYVRLPACVGETAHDRAGWIEFGRPPESLKCRSTPQTRQICPREGRLLLFPSYYYHHTVPFESDELRISIAFDVLPAT